MRSLCTWPAGPSKSDAESRLAREFRINADLVTGVSLILVGASGILSNMQFFPLIPVSFLCSNVIANVLIHRRRLKTNHGELSLHL